MATAIDVAYFGRTPAKAIEMKGKDILLLHSTVLVLANAGRSSTLHEATDW